MDQQVLVSVLMTAFNREEFIVEAIESVLAQTYRNFELIIIDDGSKDKTVDITKIYEQKDCRVKVYVNIKNLGDYPNRNKAASYANGSILMYVDSDDTINNDALEYVVSAFNKFPSSSFATIYKDIADKSCTIIDSFNAIHQHFFIKSFLHIGPGGTAIKRQFFFEMGKFPELYGPANDMYYNVKNASNSPVILMGYDYLFYREHDGQENKNIFSYLYNNYLYANDLMLLPEIPLSLEEKEYLIKKNKRRFVVNVIKYYIRTKDLVKTLVVIKSARFQFKDFLKGIFH